MPLATIACPSFRDLGNEMNLLTQHQQNKPQPSSSSLQQLKASNKVAAPSAPFLSDSKHLTQAAQGWQHNATKRYTIYTFWPRDLVKLAFRSLSQRNMQSSFQGTGISPQPSMSNSLLIVGKGTVVGIDCFHWTEPSGDSGNLSWHRSAKARSKTAASSAPIPFKSSTTAQPCTLNLCHCPTVSARRLGSSWKFCRSKSRA